MQLLSSVLRFAGICAHPQTYRERRDLDGVPVLHFVCDSCGHAVPAVSRTPAEHRQAVRAGAIRPLAVHRQTLRVAVPIERAG